MAEEKAVGPASDSVRIEALGSIGWDGWNNIDRST